MESRAKFMGHPLHPMLIVFPLGLLVTSVIFDVAYLLTENTFFTTVSYYNILAGMIGGVVAAIFGFRDYLAIPSDTRAKRIGAYHGIGNVIMVLLFLVSWLMRRGSPDFIPSTLAFFVSVLGILLGSVTGWLGGELVNRLGVGVDPGANVNASSSLTGQPASQSMQTPSIAPAAVPVTGGDKYQEKHIQKNLPTETEIEPKSGIDPRIEHDNLD